MLNQIPLSPMHSAPSRFVIRISDLIRHSNFVIRIFPSVPSVPFVVNPSSNPFVSSYLRGKFASPG